MEWTRYGYCTEVDDCTDDCTEWVQNLHWGVGARENLTNNTMGVEAIEPEGDNSGEIQEKGDIRLA
jgi:hypothetical protein